MLTAQTYGYSRLVESPDSAAVAMLSLMPGNEGNTAGATQTSRDIEAMRGRGSLERPRKMTLPLGGTI
jgi:uncharacterized protein with GYD domain